MGGYDTFKCQCIVSANAFCQHLPVARSTMPTTQNPHLRWPWWYFLLKKYVSSISTYIGSPFPSKPPNATFCVFSRVIHFTRKKLLYFIYDVVTSYRCLQTTSRVLPSCRGSSSASSWAPCLCPKHSARKMTLCERLVLYYIRGISRRTLLAPLLF